MHGNSWVTNPNPVQELPGYFSCDSFISLAYIDFQKASAECSQRKEVTGSQRAPISSCTRQGYQKLKDNVCKTTSRKQHTAGTEERPCPSMSISEDAFRKGGSCAKSIQNHAFQSLVKTFRQLTNVAHFMQGGQHLVTAGMNTCLLQSSQHYACLFPGSSGSHRLPH